MTTSTPSLVRTLRALPPAVYVLVAGVLINRAGSFLQIFLVLYLTGTGFSPVLAGAALTAYGIGSILGSVVAGTLTERLGPRRVIVYSMLVSAAGVALFPAVHSYPLMLGLSLFIGIFTFLYWPAALEMLAVITDEEHLVVASAAYRLGLNIGAVLAPLIGVAMIAGGNYVPIFLGDAATSVVFALVALVFLPRTTAAEPGDGDTPGRAGYAAVLRDRRFLLVLLAALAIATAEAQYQSVLPLQVRDQGLPDTWYAAVVAINAAMIILFELPVTGLVRRLPMRLTMAAGGALIGIGMAIFGLPWGGGILIAGAVIWTIGEIVSAPSIISYPAVAAPVKQLRGRYISAVSGVQTLGLAFGPLLGTVLFQYGGALVWCLCLVLAATAGFGMAFGARARQPVDQEQ